MRSSSNSSSSSDSSRTLVEIHDGTTRSACAKHGVGFDWDPETETWEAHRGVLGVLLSWGVATIAVEEH